MPAADSRQPADIDRLLGGGQRRPEGLEEAKNQRYNVALKNRARRRLAQPGGTLQCLTILFRRIRARPLTRTSAAGFWGL